MNNKRLNNREGFTLIEVLLYITISSVLVLMLSGFLFLMLQSRVKHQTISSVNQEGSLAVNMIAQSIRNSNGINLPAQGSSGGMLSLNFADSAKNPTVFNSDGTNTNIQIKEGVDPIIPLTSSNLIISGLTFTNVSKDDTPGIIRFQFTVDYNNLSGRNEYSYSEDFFGSASLRE